MITKRLYIPVLCILLAQLISAQQGPYTFDLSKELTKQTATDYSTPASNSVSSIVIVGDTIWLGTSRGLSRSTDNGLSWVNYYNTSPFGTDNVSAVAYDYSKNVIWCALAKTVEENGQDLPAGMGLCYSADNGATWTRIPQPLDNDNDTTIVYGINTLRALPVTVNIQNITYDIAINSNAVFITSFAGGVRKTTDMGVTWERVVIPPDYLNDISPDDTLDFCLSPVAGNFCSSGNLNHRAFSVITVGDTTVYVGTANGINKSIDGGISWVKMNHQNQDYPISGNFVVGMDYSQAADIVWAATWRAEDNNEFYAVSYSNNAGAEWKTTLEGEKAHNFGSNSTRVIAATDNGPFKSDDAGATWLHPGIITDKETGLTLQTNVFYDAEFDNSGTPIWLGSNDGFLKNNGVGSGWADEWTILFASQPLTGLEDAYAFPNPFNPKTESVKIKYSTGGESKPVTIRIFDFGMNYIRTVIQSVERGAPEHIVGKNGPDDIEGVIDFWDGRTDDGSIVPNGVYFYRVEVGDNEPVYGKIMVIQ